MSHEDRTLLKTKRNDSNSVKNLNIFLFPVVRVGRNFPGKFEFVPNGMEFQEILGPLETSRVRLGIRGRRNLRGDAGTIP